MAQAIVSATKSAISELLAEMRKNKLLSKLWDSVKGVMHKSAARLRTFIPDQLKVIFQNIKTSFWNFGVGLMQTLANGLVITTAKLGTKLLTPILSDYVLEPSISFVEEQVFPVLEAAIAGVDAFAESTSDVGEVAEDAPVAEDLLAAGSLVLSRIATSVSQCATGIKETLRQLVAQEAEPLASAIVWGLLKALPLNQSSLAEAIRSYSPPFTHEELWETAVASVSEAASKCLAPAVGSGAMVQAVLAEVQQQEDQELCAGLASVLHVDVRRTEEVVDTRGNVLLTFGELRVRQGSDTYDILLNTLEPPWRDNLPSRSRIPAGEYTASVKAGDEVACGRDKVLLQAVPDRFAISLGCGDNGVLAESQGSILVGNGRVDRPVPMLLNGKTALQSLTTLLHAHQGSIIVTVTDVLPPEAPASQSVGEQIARLAVGAYEPATMILEAGTHAAEGWGVDYTICQSEASLEPLGLQSHASCAVVSSTGSRCAVTFPGRALEDWVGGSDTYGFSSALVSDETAMFVAESGSFVVHAQILQEYNAYKAAPDWIRWIEMSRSPRCQEVHIVGHSLGGAIAVLHRLDHKQQTAPMFLHTFGAPRPLQSRTQLDCAQNFRYWLQDGGRCGDPITALPSNFHHGPLQSVQLLRINSRFEVSYGLCHVDEAGSNWEQGLTSPSCRELHLAESYLASIIGRSCTNGAFLHVTSLLVNEVQGAGAVYAGEKLGLTWTSCDVATVRVVLEDETSGSSLKSWLMDARAGRFMMVWESQSGHRHRFKIMASGVSRMSSVSRWIQTPPSGCQSSSASAGTDALQGLTRAFDAGSEMTGIMSTKLSDALKGFLPDMLDRAQQEFGESTAFIESFRNLDVDGMMSAASGAAESIQGLIGSSVDPDKSSDAVDLSSLLSAITSSSGEGNAMQQMETSVDGVKAMLMGSVEDVLGNFVPSGAMSFFAGMVGGDAEPLCDEETTAAVDEFTVQLRGLRDHDLYQKFRSLGQTILHFTSLGYRLLDALYTFKDGVDFMHLFAELLQPIPLAGQIATIIAKGLAKLKTFVGKVVKAADKLADNFLEPACNLGNVFSKELEWFVNKLEGVAFALGLVIRPPSELPGEIGRSIRVCTMLQAAAPVGNMAMTILNATNEIPGIDRLPTTPFTPDLEGIFAAWDHVKRFIDTMMGPFRGIWNILTEEWELCILGICYSFQLKDVLRGASFILDLFNFLLQIFMIPFQPVIDIVTDKFQNAFLSLLGDIAPQLVGDDAVAFTAEGAPQAESLPSLSSVDVLMRQNPEEEILREQRERLQGCLLLNTALRATDDPIDAIECAQGSRVAWPAQCDRFFCQECTECQRWWMQPEDDGSFRCYLHKRAVAYFRVSGATAGMKRQSLCLSQRNCANLWDEGPTQHCVGEKIGTTGLTSEGDCREFCCRDLHCNLWQWHSARKICQMGRSRDCNGEAGWIGGRKKQTAAEMFKTMCGNADAARSNPDGVDADIQTSLDLMSSTCFEKTCALQGVEIPECMSDAEAFLETGQEKFDKYCKSIPTWEVTEWSNCSASLCGVPGIQEREVKCSAADKPEWCAAVREEPNSTKPCLGRQCFWRTGSFTACDATTCGTVGRRSRTVECAGGGSGSAPAYLCQSILEPAREVFCYQVCNETSNASPGTDQAWNISNVSDATPGFGGPAESCGVRRLRAQPMFIPTETPEEPTKAEDLMVGGVPARTKRRLEETDESPYLTFQECAELASELAVCQLQQFSAVPPDAGGTAGLVLQNSLCQNQMLDEMLDVVQENHKLLTNIDKKITQQTDEIKEGMADLQSNLTGVMGMVGEQVTAEVSEMLDQRVSATLAEMRMQQAALMKAVSCNSNRQLEEIKARIEEMELLLLADMDELQEEMQQSFSDLSAQLEDVRDAFLVQLADSSAKVVSTIENQINASEARLKTFVNATLSMALQAAAEDLTEEILQSEDRLAEHMQTQILGAVEQLEASSVDQTAEILASIEELKAGLASQMDSVSDAMSGVLSEAIQSQTAQTEFMLDELSSNIAMSIASAAAAQDFRAAERSAQLEAVLSSAISSSTGLQQDAMRALRQEVQRGNSMAIAAGEEAVLALGNELRERFQGIEQAMDGFDRLSGLVSQEMSEVNARLDSTHQSVRHLQQDFNVLMQQNELQLRGIEGVEDRVTSLLGNVSELADTVRSGQQKLTELLAVSSRKMDKVLSQVQGMSQFDESSVLIDGAFLDFSYELLPRAAGSIRKVSNMLGQYSSCSAYWGDVVGSLRSSQGDQSVARNRLREIWGTVRDRFVIAAGILTKGGLLRINFDTVSFMVEASMLAESLSVESGECRIYFGRSGARAIRQLLLEQLKAQPLVLAKRATGFWHEITEILEQSESLGSVLPASERRFIERAYEDLLREILMLREQLVMPGQGGINMMQRAHMQVLDLHLPKLCPPAPACTSAIFITYAEVDTDELVTWRRATSATNASLEALVVVRQPSILLFLQGLFSWDFDLADPSSWPSQLPSDFVQAVYLCVPKDSFAFTAYRAPGPEGFEEAFRFCSVPAVGDGGDGGSLRCGSPGADFGRVPVDSHTPGSKLGEDIFAEWEVEARDAKVLTSVCGNGELEFGEVCDEGPVASSGCLSCREVALGYTCTANTTCTPLCGDGLLFEGVEECDDGGFLQGCSASCKLLACKRLEVAVSASNLAGLSWRDQELMSTLREAHLVPAVESPEELELQGYIRCFSSSGNLSADPATALAACSGATRLSLLGRTTGGTVRHDVELQEALVPAQGMHYEAGPYQLRSRPYPDSTGTTELLLSCRAGLAVWHRCRFWGVQVGESTRTTVLSQDGLSFEDLENESVLEIWIPPPTSLWLCQASSRVSTACGDGSLTGPEECDDGNTVSGDGCDASCSVEGGYLCASPGFSCSATWCGDGIAGALPSLCDFGLRTPGCRSCVVEAGWICHANCSSEIAELPLSSSTSAANFSGEDSDVVDTLASAFFSEEPEICCLQGPVPENSSCTLGDDCQIAVRFHGADAAGLIVSSGLDVCGSTAQAVFGPSPMQIQGDFQVFDLGRLLTVSAGSYTLCWGPDPSGFWSSEVFELRGHDSTSSGAMRRMAAYPFDVGRLSIRGPQGGQHFQCTLGMKCEFYLEGHNLPADSAVLPVRGSCTDLPRRPAPVDQASLRVESRSLVDGDLAEFVLNETKVHLQEVGDLVFVVFSALQHDSPAQQFGFSAGTRRSADLVQKLRRVPESSLVLVAAKGLAAGLGSLPPRILAQLEKMGARQLTNGTLTAYTSYCLAVHAGHTLAEKGTLPGEGPAVIQEFVATPASAKAADVTAHFQLGLMRGTAATYRLCWDSRAGRDLSGDGFHVDAGHLHVQGPASGAWTCFAGSPCTLSVEAEGQLAHSGEMQIGTMDTGCADLTTDSEDSDSLGIAGFHIGPVVGALRDTAGVVVDFALGTSAERRLGLFAVCWRPVSDSDWVLVGRLQLSEQRCNLADIGPGEVHDCLDVPFGGSCASGCRPGWSGANSTLLCESDGQLTGSQTDCSEVPCSSASFNAVKEQDECLCTGGFFGSITWLPDLHTYLGHCRSCEDAVLACEAGYYRNGCGGASVGECLPCIGLVLGQYFTSHGGLREDGCMQGSCIRCAVGQYTFACSGTSPGECRPCQNAPSTSLPTMYYNTNGGVTGECGLADCLKNCPVGQYRKDCGGTSPGFCATCSRPASGRFLSSSGGLEDACESLPCPECLVGFYRAGCSLTDEGACVPCSNGPAEGFHYTSHGGTRNDCSFETCQNCEVGWYRRGCRESFWGECHPCTFKPPDTYFTGHGGISNQCPYGECDRGVNECPLGQFRDNCGSSSDPSNLGTCKNCTERAEEHYFTGHGGTSPRGCPQQPCQACRVGFFRLGCGLGGVSPGECQPCQHTPDHYFTSHGGFVLEVGEGVQPAECSQASCWNSSSSCPAGYRLGGCGEDEHHVSPGNCLPCPAGRFTSRENWHEPCELCSPGYYSLRGATACTACPAGKFADASGKSACSWCIGGSTNVMPPRDSCSPCELGQYNEFQSGKDECQVCAGGEVRRRAANGQGAVDCTECSIGFYDEASSDGETCTQCIGGEVRRRRAISCEDTAPGKFNVGDRDEAEECIGGAVRRRRANECAPCPDGFWDKETRDTTDPDDCMRCIGQARRREFTAFLCDSCDSGKYNPADITENDDPDTCMQCYGDVVDDASGCLNCSTSHYKSEYNMSSDTCLPCLGGLVGRIPPYSTCRDCPEGEYSNGAQDGCIEVPEGHEVQRPLHPYSQPGEISICPAGWVSSGGQDTCTTCAGKKVEIKDGLRVDCGEACPPGRYNDGTSDTCMICDGDVSGDQTVCTKCDAGANLYDPGPFDGEQDRNDGCRPCQGGHIVNGECKMCQPEGGFFQWNPGSEPRCMQCIGGTVDELRPVSCNTCPPGQYQGTDASGHAENACTSGQDCQISPNRTVCTSCPIGMYKYDPTGDDCESCKPGHDGEQCQYFESDSIECEDAIYKAPDFITREMGERYYQPKTCSGDSCTISCSDARTCTLQEGWHKSPPTCTYRGSCQRATNIQRYRVGTVTGDEAMSYVTTGSLPDGVKWSFSFYAFSQDPGLSGDLRIDVANFIYTGFWGKRWDYSEIQKSSTSLGSTRDFSFWGFSSSGEGRQRYAVGSHKGAEWTSGMVEGGISSLDGKVDRFRFEFWAWDYSGATPTMCGSRRTCEADFTQVKCERVSRGGSLDDD